MGIVRRITRRSHGNQGGDLTGIQRDEMGIARGIGRRSDEDPAGSDVGIKRGIARVSDRNQEGIWRESGGVRWQSCDEPAGDRTGIWWDRMES